MTRSAADAGDVSNPVPVMVMGVPPVRGPPAGSMKSTDGAPNVNRSPPDSGECRLPPLPSGTVTITSVWTNVAVVSAVMSGETAVISVSDTTVNDVAAAEKSEPGAPPVKENVTAVAADDGEASKPVPVIVMAVPPVRAPPAGATLSTTGPPNL